MQFGLARDFLPFQNLFDQVDAATRSVELITKQLIGRTGSRTKSTMNAAAQNRFCFFALAGVLDEVG
jgi:hypothetical protein